MKRTYLNAVPATFALYEGHAVAEARGHSYITDNDRQMGVAYLLCLMAVAFRAYERLDWERRSIFEEYAREFKESLQQDGFVYHHEAMYETATAIASSQCYLTEIHPVQWYLQSLSKRFLNLLRSQHPPMI